MAICYISHAEINENSILGVRSHLVHDNGYDPVKCQPTPSIALPTVAKRKKEKVFEYLSGGLLFEPTILSFDISLQVSSLVPSSLC